MLSGEFAELERLSLLPDTHPRIKLLLELQKKYYNRLVNTMNNSPSQIRQDALVLAVLDFKTGGYFVEFGASNGVSNSNTWLLEKHYGWTGILAEPARVHHPVLFANRQCYISTDCVYTQTGSTVMFNQVHASAELSTIDMYTDKDKHAHLRDAGDRYPVPTISLVDLLKKYNAPDTIDYMSIDTEGSEWDILTNFDWSLYKIRIITCEHNHTEDRQKIYEFLSTKGYERVYAEFSDFDDWYILKDNK